MGQWEPGWRRRRMVPIAVVVLSAGACSSSSEPDGLGGSVAVSVTPQTSGIASPVAIEVSGLDEDGKVTMHLESTDAQDAQWASDTTYQADRDGTLNVDFDDANAEAMDPISAMTSIGPGSPPAAYVWSGEPQTFTLSVLIDDQEHVQAEFDRGVPLGEPAQMTTIAGEGFTGSLWMPPAEVEVRTPAIVNIEGSGGGLLGTVKAAALAAEGYPVLDVAYFQGPFADDPDLPGTLSEIPLEYFTEAISWLSDQPEIDPGHIYVMGTSRGSEAALLLGSEFPDLVFGVIAVVPSSAAICSFPACSGPAWTLGEEPLPFTQQLNNPNPSDEPAAVIAVENIAGPVLSVCAAQDKVWDSCAHGAAINDRLADAEHADAHQLITQQEAGHSLGRLVPYQPRMGDADPQLAGSSDEADSIALAQTWPQVIDFLRSEEEQP